MKPENEVESSLCFSLLQWWRNFRKKLWKTTKFGAWVFESWNYSFANTDRLRLSGHNCHSGQASCWHSLYLQGLWIPWKCARVFSPWEAETHPAGCTVELQGKPRCMAITSWFPVVENKLSIFGDQNIKYTHLKHPLFPTVHSLMPLLDSSCPKCPVFRFYSWTSIHIHIRI